MCATRSKPPRKPLDEMDFAFLHRKELKKGKGISPELAWLLVQLRDRTGEGTKLFKPLPPNPALLPFDKQGYMQWKALYDSQKMTHPRRMRRRTVVIQPLSYTSDGYILGVVDPQVLAYLQGFCRAFFHGMDILVVEPVDLADLKMLTTRIHADTGREQFLVGDIMKFLRTHKVPKAFCTVGLTIADLYPGPQWNFSLGHASLTNGVAVCSFGRYFNSGIDCTRPSHHTQLHNLWILVRVLTHEMCHVFGLKHCHFFNCAMNESSSILQAALQPLFLCPICLRKLQKVLQFDILERYQALEEQCQELFKITKRLLFPEGVPSPFVPGPSGYRPPAQDSALQLNHDSNCITASTMTTANSMAATLSESSCETSSDLFSEASGDLDHPRHPISWQQDILSGRAAARRDAAEFATEAEVLNCPPKHFDKAHSWLQNAIRSMQQFMKAVEESRRKKEKQR